MARKINQLMDDPAEAAFWGAAPEGIVWVGPSPIEINAVNPAAPLADAAPAPAGDPPMDDPPAPRPRSRAKRKKA